MARHVLTFSAPDPDKTALRVLGGDGSESWSYGALEQAVRGTGTGLLQAGLKPGDIVLMRLGNTVDFPIAYLGALAAGLVPVPTSSQLTERETAGMVADLSPAAVLHDPAVVGAGGTPDISVAQLRRMRDLRSCDWHMGAPERPGYIVYTSGSSGKPRAVVHAHRAIWARQMMVDGWYGLRPDDLLLHAGAFNWTYTLGTGLMDPWTSGATALIPAPGTDPSDLPRLLADAGATIFAAAPGVYRKMLAGAGQLDLPDLRHGLTAGEKLSEHLRQAWQAATGKNLFEAYGMSECSTFISSCPSAPAMGGALGRPQKGRRIAILEGGAPVPLGIEGVIAVHQSDPGLMLGYHGNPGETAARFAGDWFLTGDRGHMDPEGQIHFAGRDDDMMNAGGFRVSPLEVEAALVTIPGLHQIGVTDVEVKADTRVIAAFYTGDARLDPAMLDAFAQERLARYKQPRAWIHLPALPVNANGKLLRSALRDQFKADVQ